MNTKKIIIEDVKYSLEHTKKGKIKNVFFDFKFEDGSMHKSTAHDVNTMAFRFEIPYTSMEQGLTNFNKVKYFMQIEALDKLVSELCGSEIEVGYFESVYYDLKVMRLVMNENSHRYLIPAYCNTSNGRITTFEYDDNLVRKFHPPFDTIMRVSKNKEI